MSIESTSGILYVRASLKPFARQIKSAGGVIEFLRQTFAYDEIFVPYFFSYRPFWRAPDSSSKVTNSGALGRYLAERAGAVVSQHPTHRFAGIGTRVGNILRTHDHEQACFHPVRELARQYDFSMLLLGCVDESPGFSTVHVTQHELGLTQKHLIRYLLRWDIDTGSKHRSIWAREVPGCSLSFNKFYPAYEQDENLIGGKLLGQEYLYVKSAARALATERRILSRNPRFVDCGRMMCPTCRFRLY